MRQSLKLFFKGNSGPFSAKNLEKVNVKASSVAKKADVEAEQPLPANSGVLNDTGAGSALKRGEINQNDSNNVLTNINFTLTARIRPTILIARGGLRLLEYAEPGWSIDRTVYTFLKDPMKKT